MASLAVNPSNPNDVYAGTVGGRVQVDRRRRQNWDPDSRSSDHDCRFSSIRPTVNYDLRRHQRQRHLPEQPRRRVSSCESVRRESGSGLLARHERRPALLRHQRGRRLGQPGRRRDLEKHGRRRRAGASPSVPTVPARSISGPTRRARSCFRSVIATTGTWKTTRISPTTAAAGTTSGGASAGSSLRVALAQEGFAVAIDPRTVNTFFFTAN